MIISVLFARPETENAKTLHQWKSKARKPSEVECIFPDNAGDSLALAWNSAAAKASGEIFLAVDDNILPCFGWDALLVQVFKHHAVAAVLLPVTGLNSPCSSIASVRNLGDNLNRLIFHPDVCDSDALDEFEVRYNLTGCVAKIKPAEMHFVKVENRPLSRVGMSLKELWPLRDAHTRSRTQPGLLSPLAERLCKIVRKLSAVTELGVSDGELTIALLHSLAHSETLLTTYADENSCELQSLSKFTRFNRWRVQQLAQEALPHLEKTEALIITSPEKWRSLRDTLSQIANSVSKIIAIPYTSLYAYTVPTGGLGLRNSILSFLHGHDDWVILEESDEGAGFTLLTKKTEVLSFDSTPIVKRVAPGLHGPLINVVTRTAKRPRYFNRNAHSVRTQSYKPVRHIVLCHESTARAYVSLHPGVHVFSANLDALVASYDGPHFVDSRFWPAPYNLLCNVGLDACEDGWITFLDDDDVFHNQDTLACLSEHLTDEDTLVIHRFTFQNGTTIPPDNIFNSRVIALNGIGTGCFTFHSKWKKYIRWDMYKCADYRLAVQLASTIPKIKWVNQSVVLMSPPGSGKALDLK
jgi:hypothetical protein